LDSNDDDCDDGWDCGISLRVLRLAVECGLPHSRDFGVRVDCRTLVGRIDFEAIVMSVHLTHCDGSAD